MEATKPYKLYGEDLISILKELQNDGHLKGYLEKIGISYDESNDKSSASAAKCGHCCSIVREDGDGVCCTICEIWYHIENDCSGIDNTYKDLIDSDNIWYICNKCKTYDLSRFKKSINTGIIDDKLEVLKTNSDILAEMMHDTAEKTREVVDNMDKIHTKIDNVTVTSEKTYADSLKSKKAIVVKSKRDECKVAKDKKSIMSKIETPVEEVKETKEGHLYVRFADKNKLEDAKREFEQIDLTVNEKGKRKPMIKVVNVPNDEEDIISNIKMKNPSIGNLIENEDDLKIIKELKAKDSKYKHYILKCTPKIRKTIYENENKLYTLYNRCKVYDCYMPYQCYKCQDFGHSAVNCNNNQVCPKCSGNHRYKDCDNTVLKCNNCVKKGHSEMNHKTFDAYKCAVYNEEMSKARNNTDHGFD